MNPEDITLTNTTQQFEYEKLSREIDCCEDVKELQQMCIRDRSYSNGKNVGCLCGMCYECPDNDYGY